MFIVQVDFKDATGAQETVLIRRLHARIGTSDSCHLIVDGVAELDSQILLTRGLADDFYVSTVNESGKLELDKYPWARRYQSSADIELDELFLRIFCVPTNIAAEYSRSETCDVGVQLSGLGAHFEKREFPALVMLHDPFIALSFPKNQSFYIGRSRKCLFRLDNLALETVHAEIQNDGRQFLIAPSGDDNFISVNGSRATGRVFLNPKDQVCLGDGINFGYVNSEEDIEDFVNEIAGRSSVAAERARSAYLYAKSRYYLRGSSDLISPQVLTLKSGQTISVGRDPSHAIWVDSPHVSRLHCTIMIDDQVYRVQDFSTNGTFINDERVPQGEVVSCSVASEVTISLGKDLNLVLSYQGVEIHKAEDVFSDSFENQDASNKLVQAEKELSDMLSFTGGSAESQEDFAQDVMLQNNAETSSASSFADFQKRSVRLMEETGHHPLLDEDSFSEQDAFEESVIRVGLKKYVVPSFTAILILLILVVFLILAQQAIP